MAKPSDHPGFKSLLEAWNSKLKESGFKDIETECKGQLVLKQVGAARSYERMDETRREARIQFFRQVTLCTAETEFKNELDRQILTLYGQGYSQAAIKKVLGIQGHRCKVYYPIYRWLKIWGLR